MSFTYDPTSVIGKVRRLIGDTDESTSETSDETIEAWLAENANSAEATAIKILRSLAASYSRKATITSGNEKIEYGNVAKNLIAMVNDLEGSMGTKGSGLKFQPVQRL